MVKSQLQVFVRIKPSGDQPLRSTKIVPYTINKTHRKLEIEVSRTKVMSSSKDNFQYNFTHVFDKESTQEQIYEKVALPVINNCLEGYNGTIFAYGQTGSGKTYTMNRGETWQSRGIIPRVLSGFFDEFERRADTHQYRMFVSYMEIYNENAYDLLDKKHIQTPLETWNKVTCYEDEDGVVQMKNLSSHFIEDEQEGVDLLLRGDHIKSISATSLNQSSSRSHCVFTVTIEGKNTMQGTEFVSKLHLVDLAGSERISKSGVQGTNLTEAKSINLSLSYLQQVIVALNDKLKNGIRNHIPYRNSLMTTVLKDSLGGNCRTVMIATISSEQDNIDETISTLRFSQRVGQLENEVVKNEKGNANVKVKQLEKQNAELLKKLERIEKQNKQLKEKVAMRDVSSVHNNKCEQLTNTPGLKPSEIPSKVQNYLNDKTKKLQIRNIRQAQLCFQNMKELYHSRMKEYVTQLSFISEKLQKYDQLLSKKKVTSSRDFSDY